ncbi:hypothetical protein MAP00_005094 [Neofusicoccum parvum]|uniref:Uncharacterized protein n=1 Tax=Neofusicoccum parvum TaxID=310453 RepID=A0ACB5RS72_9PEZI|nr:hypothetical protein MAP00_005094 [Neofusicoccum parvum]
MMMAAAAGYGHHGGCDCLHHTTLASAQIPRHGAVAFETLLGIGPLVHELWERIDACGPAQHGSGGGAPLLAHALVGTADAVANLCHAACAAYALVDPSKQGPTASTVVDQILSAPPAAAAAGGAPPSAADPLAGPDRLVCTRSPMRFGKYELDDQEAALFARQVLCRLLTDLSAFLRKVRNKGRAVTAANAAATTGGSNVEQWSAQDIPISRALSRVLSLLGRLCSD